MEQATLKIQGMGCRGCVNTVQEALTELDGVEKALVDLESATAMVEFDSNKVSISECKQAIQDAGYLAQ
mgnify:FL=1